MDGNLVDKYKYVTTCYIVILRSETPDSRNGLQAAMCFVLADLILRYIVLLFALSLVPEARDARRLSKVVVIVRTMW